MCMERREKTTGCHQAHDPDGHRRRATFMTRWMLANSTIAGVLALVWLVLRTGSKPSRFLYPCQQAAWSAATLAFGVPLASSLVAARRQLAARLRSPGGIASQASRSRSSRKRQFRWVYGV